MQGDDVQSTKSIFGRLSAIWALSILALLATGSSCFADTPSSETLFDLSRISTISITLPDDDWKALCKQSRDPGKAFSGVSEEPFTWFKGDITIDGMRIESVGIRKKGFLGSLDEQWPSLKVKLDKYSDRSPIEGIDTLTLNNNKQDTALVSQILSYQLFNAAGVNAPRCSFTRVTANGQDLGLYLNVESVGKQYLKRRFGNNTGNLYEGTLADFYPKALHRLEVKSNKGKHNNATILKLSNMLSDTAPLNLDELEQMVDVDNFLKFWAIESLIGFWDGYTNNQNNYWVYENPQNKKLYFMPWGADGAFMPAFGFPGFGPARPISIYSEGYLANRLFRHESIPNRYRDTMRWVLENVWKEDELLKTVDRIETLVSTDLHQRQREAPRSMKRIRDFINTRRQKIEQELDKWPVKIADEPRKPMYTVPLGTATGSFKTKWSDSAPKEINTIGELKAEILLDGMPVELSQQGASAHKKARGFPFGFGPPRPDEPTDELVLCSIRNHDGKKITITLPFNSKELSNKIGQSIEVRGAYSTNEQKNQGFMPFSPQFVEGTIVLKALDATSDGAVEGDFQLTISEIHGGFMARPTPKPNAQDRRDQPNGEQPKP